MRRPLQRPRGLLGVDAYAAGGTIMRRAERNVLFPSRASLGSRNPERHIPFMTKPSLGRSKARASPPRRSALRLARSAASVTPLPRSSSERSLRLLQCVAAADRAVSLADLSERLALPKATLHRLCTQLTA